MRDWVTNVATTNYIFGTVAGPHPFPAMVRDFQKIIGEEAREQLLGGFRPATRRGRRVRRRRLDAMRIFDEFLDDESVALYGFEAAGKGVDTPRHAPPSPRAALAYCAAPAATCCRTTTGKPSNRTPSPPG